MRYAHLLVAGASPHVALVFRQMLDTTQLETRNRTWRSTSALYADAELLIENDAQLARLNNIRVPSVITNKSQIG